jgi:hypothetical protein
MNSWPAGSAHRYPLMLPSILLFNSFRGGMRVGDG